MWAECVLPSLFPFMIITLLLTKMGAVDVAARPFKKVCAKFNLPPCFLPLLILGAASGYPAGARILYEYYDGGMIGEEDCKKLAPLVSCCGPLFAVGTVGVTANKSYLAGLIIYLSCAVTVTVTSLLYCLLKRGGGNARPQKLNKRGGDVLYSAFSGGVSASLTAGAFICFFYTLSVALCDFNALAPLVYILSPVLGGGAAEALAPGFVEATGACFSLARLQAPRSLPLTGFIITFGGVSILLQQTYYLSRCKVSAARFAAFKFIQAVICFFLVWIIISIFPQQL